jgi:hypothetical protein
MSHTITPQHPAVVLRSHYVHLRSLLAIAMIAVVGLTVAVVILATNNGDRTSKSSATPVTASAQLAPGVRFDGGPEESSVAAAIGSRPAVGPRESRIAASIGASSHPISHGPDESRTAAAIGGTPSRSSAGPDESRIAASISDR